MTHIRNLSTIEDPNLVLKAGWWRKAMDIRDRLLQVLDRSPGQWSAWYRELRARRRLVTKFPAAAPPAPVIRILFTAGLPMLSEDSYIRNPKEID